MCCIDLLREMLHGFVTDLRMLILCDIFASALYVAFSIPGIKVMYNGSFYLAYIKCSVMKYLLVVLICR